jgi:hypothetical protein
VSAQGVFALLLHAARLTPWHSVPEKALEELTIWAVQAWHSLKVPSWRHFGHLDIHYGGPQSLR